MKATNKEINEYKELCKERYGHEITYLKPNITKSELKLLQKGDVKREIKTTIKSIFRSLVDVCANLFTKLLIWFAAILYLIESEHTSLGYLLFISGLAYIYNLIKNAREQIRYEKEEDAKNAD